MFAVGLSVPPRAETARARGVSATLATSTASFPDAFDSAKPLHTALYPARWASLQEEQQVAFREPDDARASAATGRSVVDTPVTAQYACNCGRIGYLKSRQSVLAYYGSFAVSDCSKCNVVPNDCIGHFPATGASGSTCSEWPTAPMCSFAQFSGGCSVDDSVLGATDLEPIDQCVNLANSAIHHHGGVHLPHMHLMGCLTFVRVCSCAWQISLWSERGQAATTPGASTSTSEATAQARPALKHRVQMLLRACHRCRMVWSAPASLFKLAAPLQALCHRPSLSIRKRRSPTTPTSPRADSAPRLTSLQPKTQAAFSTQTSASSLVCLDVRTWVHVLTESTQLTRIKTLVMLSMYVLGEGRYSDKVSCAESSDRWILQGYTDPNCQSPTSDLAFIGNGGQCVPLSSLAVTVDCSGASSSGPRLSRIVIIVIASAGACVLLVLAAITFCLCRRRTRQRRMMLEMQRAQTGVVHGQAAAQGWPQQAVPQSMQMYRV